MNKPRNTPFRAVLFDWNGTLLDDLPNALRGWNATFRLLGVTPIARAEFRRTYRLPWQAFYRRHGVSAKTLQKRARIIDLTYFREYRRRPVRLAPGARALLKRLKNRGVILGILSDNQRHDILYQLRRLKLMGVFSFIGTSERYRPKPSPDGVHAFLRRCHLPPHGVLLVGDLADDLRAGRAAGVRTVAYLNGWQTATILRQAKPAFAIRHLGQIIRLVTKK